MKSNHFHANILTNLFFMCMKWKHIKIHSSLSEVEDEKTRDLDHESVMDYNEIRDLSDQENLHKKIKFQNQILSAINEDDSNYEPEPSLDKNSR